MSRDLTASWLRQQAARYRFPDRVCADVLAALDRVSTLRPKTDIYTYDDGRAQLLICLHGLLPILFRGASYNIPMALWLTLSYPSEPPLIYVVPTNDMLVRSSKTVDLSGRATIEYSADWVRKPESCSLAALLDALQAHFSREPPLYAKPRPKLQSTATPPPANGATSPSTAVDDHVRRVENTSVPRIPPKPHVPGALPADSVTYPQRGPSAGFLPIPQHPSPKPSSAVPPLPSTTSPQPPPVPPHPPTIHGTTSTLAANFGLEPPLPPPDYVTPQSAPFIHPSITYAQSDRDSFADRTLSRSITSSSNIHIPRNANWTPALAPTQDSGSSLGRTSCTVTDAQATVSSGLFISPTISRSESDLATRPPPSLPQKNLLDEDDTNSPGAWEAASSVKPPPRPPNPQTLALHHTLHKQLSDALVRFSSAHAGIIARQRAQQAELLTNPAAIRDEMARLSAVKDVCRGVSARWNSMIQDAEQVLGEVRRRGEVDVDEMVCASTIIGNQLVNLVAEDNAIEDTMYHLHRALNSGRIDLEKFLRTTRVLAEEQFMKRALIEKIVHGMPMGMSLG